MLNGLLSKEECAACRLCCTFDAYAAADTPTVTAEEKELILRDYEPGQKFLPKGDAFSMHMISGEDPDICICPMLDKETGCRLGDEKPFECRIWPLKVINRGDKPELTVSPLCPVIKQKPRELIEAKCKELEKLIFEKAEKCPELFG